jgi:hypothetical protein
MRNRLLGVIAGVTLAVGLLTAPAVAGDDIEERVSNTAGGTDNVSEGSGGDTATGGSMTSGWAECRSKRINKLHVRSTYSHYQFVWSLVGPIDDREIFLSENLWYRYCPNGIYPDKIKPLSWRYCHLHLPEGQVETFKGVKFASYMTDGTNTWEGPEMDSAGVVYVPRKDDGNGEGSGGANCTDYIVPGEDRKWFRVKRFGVLKTKYTTSTQANVEAFADTVDQIATDGEGVHTVFPKDDMSVGAWYGGGGNGSDITLPPQPMPSSAGIAAGSCATDSRWCAPTLPPSCGYDGTLGCPIPTYCVPPFVQISGPEFGCYDPTPSPYGPEWGCPTSGGCDPNYPPDCPAGGWTWYYTHGCTPNNQAACDAVYGFQPLPGGQTGPAKPVRIWVPGSTLNYLGEPVYAATKNACQVQVYP